MGAIGGVLARVLGAADIGGKPQNGGTGDAKHRLLEADTRQNIEFAALAGLLSIPAQEIVTQIGDHVLHEQGWRNASASEGQGVGKEGPVGKIGWLVGNLLGLGVVGDDAKEGRPAQENRPDIRNGGVGNKG